MNMVDKPDYIIVAVAKRMQARSCKRLLALGCELHAQEWDDPKVDHNYWFRCAEEAIHDVKAELGLLK
jgi:hypothetical protein